MLEVGLLEVKDGVLGGVRFPARSALPPAGKSTRVAQEVLDPAIFRGRTLAVLTSSFKPVPKTSSLA